MNDKTKQTTSEANGTLYRVTYSYLNNDGFIRNSAIVITANNPQIAEEKALEKAASVGHKHARISNTKPY